MVDLSTGAEAVWGVLLATSGEDIHGTLFNRKMLPGCSYYYSRNRYYELHGNMKTGVQRGYSPRASLGILALSSLEPGVSFCLWDVAAHRAGMGLPTTPCPSVQLHAALRSLSCLSRKGHSLSTPPRATCAGSLLLCWPPPGGPAAADERLTRAGL